MRLFKNFPNAFCLPLAFAVLMTAGPVLAQGSQHDRGTQTSPPSTAQRPPSKVQPPPPFMDPDGKDAQRTIPGAYRLTYTLTDLDGGKQLGSKQYQVVLDADAPPTLIKAGTRVPIATAATAKDNLIVKGQTEFSYIDLGVTIRARLRQFANGLELNSRIVQSTAEPSETHSSTPVIRNTSIDNTVLLSENKSVVIGKADIPGSTHSLQVKVELTPVR